VPGRDQGLLAEIKRDALDDRVPLVTILRKCLDLGEQTRNAELLAWVNRELDGYVDGDDLPEYRVIYAPLVIDAVTSSHEIRGQQISSLDLPDFAQDLITEKLELAGGVSKLQGYVRNARETSIKMSPAGTPELLKLWNHQIHATGRTIMALYWDVNVGSIEGILDQIRTTLVRLVREMRDNMPDEASAPSPKQAEHAVNVVLHRGKRNQITVTAPQSGDGSTVNIEPNGERKESGWSKATAIGTVIAVIVAIVSAYFAYRLLHQ
jgi:hypothetical protein